MKSCHDLPTSSTDSTWNTLWAGHQQGVMMNDQSMATRTPARKPVDMITIPSEGFIHSQVVQDFFHQQYITKPNNALFFSRNPSKLSYICIVWSPENWWFNDPYFKSPEKNPTVPNTRLASFSIEKSFHVGICFHLNSLLCQNPTWWDVCKKYMNAIVAETKTNTGWTKVQKGHFVLVSCHFAFELCSGRPSDVSHRPLLLKTVSPHLQSSNIVT